MATIADLPRELLFHIIFLLVQSSVGPADLASITSVCKSFLVFARDVRILRNVNFDIEMKSKKLCSYQHINGLMVRCSEAGNMAASVLLGKVILMSSSQLLLSEWRKANLDARPSDLAMLSQIVAARLPAQNNRVVSFINYFVPKQASTSECSQTRLVHYRLVKLFLLNGSHHEIIEMDAFLVCYIKYFSGATKEDVSLLDLVKRLVSLAYHVRTMEELYKMSEMVNDAYRAYIKVELEAQDCSECYENASSSLRRMECEEVGLKFRCLLLKFAIKCNEVGLAWQMEISDEPRPSKHHLDMAYNAFAICRSEAVLCFECKFG